MARFDPDATPDLGRLAEHYEILDELARGEIAATFLARDRLNGERVVIKALRAPAAESAESAARFAREAQTLEQLRHPNIVHVVRIERVGDRTTAIVTRWVAGTTLRAALRAEGPFSFARTTAVLRDIAAALRHAHRHGIVHRDVKPENILLARDDGRALLFDFGIARPAAGDGELTRHGGTIGTPRYMSPEQIDGRPLDGRSDLYSLGLVGWEMLTGRRPWAGESLYGMLHKQKHEPLPRLAAMRPGVPEPLLFAIEGALHKYADTRWTSADEFLAQLLEHGAPAGEASAARIDGRAAAPDEVADSATSRDAAADDVLEPLMMSLKPDARPAPTPPERVTAEPFDADVFAGLHDWTGESVVDQRGRRRGASRGRRAWLGVPLVGAALVALWLVASGSHDLRWLSRAGALDSLATLARGGEIAAPPAAPPARADSTSPTAAPLPPIDSAAASSAPAAARAIARAPTHADSLARCDSPAGDDQRACLLATIADNDRELNRTYGALIVALRGRAGATTGPEPSAVRALRVEQRRWVDSRDESCRERAHGGEGRLWARARATCFAEWSRDRTDELAERLAATGSS